MSLTGLREEIDMAKIIFKDKDGQQIGHVA